MELAFLLVITVSAGIGLLLRNVISQKIGRIIVVFGLAVLLLALLVLGLTVIGWVPFNAYLAGFLAVILIGISAISLPLGIAVSWRRSST